MNDFSDRLKELRKSENLTQKELAEKSGISLRSIIAYENGMRQPTSKTLNVLADFFNVSTSYLWGKTDKPSPNLGNSYPPTISKFLVLFASMPESDRKAALPLISTFANIFSLDGANREALFSRLQSLIDTVLLIYSLDNADSSLMDEDDAKIQSDISSYLQWMIDLTDKYQKYTKAKYDLTEFQKSLTQDQQKAISDLSVKINSSPERHLY